jgi:hypothetical protein
MLSEIQAQNYELIRDAIGRVLTAEFANQSNLIDLWNEANENEDGFVRKQIINPTVYLERFDAFDYTEGDCINIVYAESQLDFEHTAVTDDFDNKFIVEIYSPNKTSSESGTSIGAKKVAKIAGMIRAILKSQDYAYLDFTDKFIQHVKVQSIVRTQPREGMDAENIISGIVEVHYTAEETTELATGVIAGTLETIVKLHETDKGYKFIIEN